MIVMPRKRILVPVKPASNHSKAISVALTLAKELNAELHFITILPREEVKISREEAVAELAHNVKTCLENNVKATYDLIHTDKKEENISEELSKIAEKFDLVVMGHTQYDPIYRFLRRSPTIELINKVSNTPVLVIPEAPPPMKKLKSI